MHRPFDLFALRHLTTGGDNNNFPPVLRFGHMGLMWGLIADVDIESDRIRWAGSARFTLWALLRVFLLRKYRAKLSFVAADDHKKRPVNSVADGQSLESLMLQYAHIDSPDKVPSDWESRQALFTYFMAFNVPFCSTDYLVTPSARVNDGKLTLVTLEREESEGGPGVLESVKVLLGGRLVERSIRAFLLQPLPGATGEAKGILDLDGERIEPYGSIIVEVLPGLANLLIPEDYHEDQWQ
jgi:sphingosine kinase